MTKKFYLIVFALSILIAIIFYSETLGYYFFQDDFFEINISKASNFQEYLNFFIFRDDIIAYRPISLQNYFFLSSSFFDLNPVGFRFIVFTVFLLNAFLVAKVISKITKNQNIGLLTSSLWVTSSIHFMTLSWIAAAYNLVGTFFWLITSVLFIKFLSTNRLITYFERENPDFQIGGDSRIKRESKYRGLQPGVFYHLSLITYLFTIASFEFSITWPAIFGLYYVYVLGNSAVKSLKLFFPFIAISIIYLFLRLLLIKVPPIVEYQTTFNLESIKALFWYFLWALNIPEEFKKQVVDNLIIFNPKFSSEYWPLITKTFIGASLVLTLGIILPSYQILKSKMDPNFRILIFSLAWFLVAISPVLLLPNHTFSMYLTLASVGIYSLFSYFAVLSKKSFFIIPLITIWLYTSFTTLSFYKINSWIVEAQKFAREFSVGIKKQYPFLPSGSVIYYPLQDHRHRQALLEDHALRAIYNDQTLSIYYNKETLVNNLKTIVNRPIYIYIPQ